MYANVVHGLELGPFETLLADVMRATDTQEEADLPSEALQDLCDQYQSHIERALGVAFPEDPYVQLAAAIGAVFGNLGARSASGVLFTRDPSSGAAGAMGGYLLNAQSADVVAGIRTPEIISAEPRALGRVLQDAHGKALGPRGGRNGRCLCARGADRRRDSRVARDACGA